MFLMLAGLAATGCGDARGPRAAGKPEAAHKGQVRITQFYAGSAAVAKGEQVLLCYGVENARAVRIEPGVQGATPAYSRCVPVSPAASQKYTLTAEGEDGGTATASVVVQVVQGAKRKVREAAPAQPAGPAIVTFRTERKPGLTLLCYEVDGADAVAIEPRVLARSGALRGCLGVAPQRTTTYTLTAYGAGGRTAQRSLAVAPE